MASPLRLQVSKRTVTSIKFEWPIDFDYNYNTYYYSPIFPEDSMQAVRFQWQMKMSNSDQNCYKVLLYVSSRQITSICLSYAINFRCRKDGHYLERTISEIVKHKLNVGSWTLVGNAYPMYTNRQIKLKSILCTIDIVDDEEEAPASALFYTIPSGCLSQNFGTLLTTGKDADVVLVSKDNAQKINAHKLILMARSPVFNAMFSNEMSESISKLVVMDDLDGDVLEELIQFIYTGRVSNLSTTANRLLPAADKYDLPTLRVTCEQEIGGNLTVDNAADTLILADLHQAGQLRNHALAFIALHVQQVFTTDGWRDLKVKYPSLGFEVLEKIAMEQPLGNPE